MRLEVPRVDIASFPEVRLSDYSDNDSLDEEPVTYNRCKENTRCNTRDTRGYEVPKIWYRNEFDQIEMLSETVRLFDLDICRGGYESALLSLESVIWGKSDYARPGSVGVKSCF